MLRRRDLLLRGHGLDGARLLMVDTLLSSFARPGQPWAAVPTCSIRTAVGGCPHMLDPDSRGRLSPHRSPGAVGVAVAGGAARGGVDVADAGFLLVDGHQHVFLYNFPVGLPGHGINGNLAKISRSYEVIQRLRGF